MKSFTISPDRDAFIELAARGNCIPLQADVIADAETPVAAFRKLQDGRPCFLLESAETTDQVGRYSLLGFDPLLEFVARDRAVEIREGGARRTLEAADPLDALRAELARFRCPVESDYPFLGGAVGYLGYDAVRYFEPTVDVPPSDDLGFPDMVFMVPRVVLVFDHRYRRLRIAVHARLVPGGPDAGAVYDAAAETLRDVLARLGRAVELPQLDARSEGEPPEATSQTTRAEFEANVLQIQEYIRAGDAFQVVISQRFQTPYAGEPLDLYRALRFVNPSPYMFCLQLEGFALVGSSPEVHVRAVDGKVEIRPIAGTRKRGETPEQDAALAEELLADPKELAEHVMLVDLARNDVGRIAEFDSVRVTDRMIIERYSHVMHIVSNVVGRLRSGLDAFDVMRATFPAGTVSGSPKVRAMQIINSLEKTKRCTYAGAVGYFGFDGNLDSCITLRTVALKGGVAHVQAGAGIVADSTPEGEYRETVNKAMGMIRAIGFAARAASNKE
jgi:anthranilate synthase component 1